MLALDVLSGVDRVQFASCRLDVAKNITPALAIFAWSDDRLALQELLDDVASKYVPPHVNIFYCFGWLVRSVCASVMVPALIIVLHGCRVYLTGVSPRYLVHAGHTSCMHRLFRSHRVLSAVRPSWILGAADCIWSLRLNSPNREHLSRAT
jgi:hypothetical protein